MVRNKGVTMYKLNRIPTSEYSVITTAVTLWKYSRLGFIESVDKE